MLMQIVAIAGVSTTAVSLVAIIVLGFKLSSSKDETRTAMAANEETTSALTAMRSERDHYAMLSDTKAVELAEESRRRELAELRANEAITKTVEAVVERIHGSGIGDAVRLGNDILAMPWGRQP